MAEPTAIFDSNKIEYLQIHFDGLVTKAKRVEIQGLGTVYSSKEHVVEWDNEIEVLADVIAETGQDTPSKIAVMTFKAYTNKDPAMKAASKALDVILWKELLTKAHEDGHYVYTAVYNQEVVGVVILVKFPSTCQVPDKPKETSYQSVPESSPEPNPEDLEGVEAWAVDGYRQDLFEYNLTICLCVKQAFRHNGIGRTLIKLAVSQIPDNHVVMLHAEVGKDKLYRHIGFGLTELKGFEYNEIPKTEWNDEGWKFPTLILRKKAGSSSAGNGP
ncbi:hypothetical protein F5Y19DRAFT_469471 [Xylariaceae sp. FL1651]|nr:hypothetical protein F5Y19DRAFT_469471 [Xylariaceae sp. FL1651]